MPKPKPRQRATPVERWVAAYDFHGDQHCPATLAAFKEFVAQWKPNRRISGGDIFDLRWLRRSASDDEKMEQVTADYNAGIDFLKWFKPHIFLWGNHDQRLRDALDSAAGGGALQHLAGQWIDTIETVTRGANHYPYDKRNGVHRYADHVFIHGYAHGVGAVRKSALTYGNVVMGHVHRSDTVTVEGLPSRYGHSAGCLCRLDFDYSRANMGTLAQSNGWVYGLRIGDELIVYHARKVGGRWVYPSEITVK
jgi:hypothetical protein